MLKSVLPLLAATLGIAAGIIADCQAELSVPTRAAEFSGWQRMGLVSPWATVLQVDRTTDRIQYVQVSRQGDAKFPVYEVVSERGREGFSARDTGRLGLAIGDQEAKRRAEQRVRDLVAMGYQANIHSNELTEVRLYAQSERGMLQAMDGESGRSLWSVPLGPRSGHYFPIFARDQTLAAVSGTKVMVLDAATGTELWSAEVNGVPIAGPALSDNMVAVPLLGGFVDCYDVPSAHHESDTDRIVPPARYAKPVARFVASGYVTAAPTLSRDFLAWATNKGVVNVAALQPPKLTFRLTASPVDDALLFRNGEQLIVADRHGYVQSLDVTRGSTRWQTSTGKQIVRAPVGVGDNIYVATQRDGLLCLDAGTGETKWQAASVAAVCSISQDAVYALDYFGALRKLRLDNGTAVAIGARESGGIVVTNAVADRVYLADAVGRLVCLRESAQTWPHFHPYTPEPTIPSEQIEKEKDTTITPPTEAESTVEAENPFEGDASEPVDLGDAADGDDATATDGDDSEASTSADDPFALP